jgi:hypothetical protein
VEPQVNGVLVVEAATGGESDAVQLTGFSFPQIQVIPATMVADGFELLFEDTEPDSAEFLGRNHIRPLIAR